MNRSDAEKLKEKMSAIFANYRTRDVAIDALKSVVEIIDSLAVERDPVETDKIVEALNALLKIENDALNKQHLEDAKGIVFLKERMSHVFCAFCDHEIKLSNHESIDLHEKIKTCDELHEHMKTCKEHPLFKVQAELERYKGALRTLAKIIDDMTTADEWACNTPT